MVRNKYLQTHATLHIGEPLHMRGPWLPSWPWKKRSQQDMMREGLRLWRRSVVDLDVGRALIYLQGQATGSCCE